MEKSKKKRKYFAYDRENCKVMRAKGKRHARSNNPRIFSTLDIYDSACQSIFLG
jgi:hypothetical protein